MIIMRNFEIKVGVYPSYAEALKIVEQKSRFWGGFIGIRQLGKNKYMVYCSM